MWIGVFWSRADRGGWRLEHSRCKILRVPLNQAAQEKPPMSASSLVSLLSIVLAAQVPKDAPAKKRPDGVPAIPPAGIKLTDSDRVFLSAGVDDLGKEIDALGNTPKESRELLPDVQIFHNAVRCALKHDEFFDAREIAVAKRLVEQGHERAAQLREGKAPWNTATGLLVRGYVSRIDGSVQPYGLVVPASYQANSPDRYRLDVWCHGRQERLSELSFINGRQRTPGEFLPPGAFVLHPYGRYCNANRFAGEVDLFEAIDDIKKHYPIDENRIVMRGFSMGGAACWQFAVHFPSTWVAAAPGAGFTETAEFLRIFRSGASGPPAYEQKLWHLYDSKDYAANLYNCPTVAYSGEVDRQKQAADVMAKALKDEGIEMVHIIGAKAGHNYTAEAKVQINQRIDAIAAAGRDPLPDKVCFTTWTLRYNRSFWVQIDGLEQHWERARVEADLLGGKQGGPQLKTTNVSALTLLIPSGLCPFDVRKQPVVEIDGDSVPAPQPLSDRSWTASFHKAGSKWVAAPPEDDGKLHKRHGLQGPIDDAFMDSFMMVRPTGPELNEKVGKWVTAEMKHAVDHWRRQFRGEARVNDDKDITDADIAAHNLVLWGDPSSNLVLAKIAGKLPLKWDKDTVALAGETFPAGHHVPVLIYPNPLNPKRYVVVNSGFTFREFDYTSNARQTPKLPDVAVIDIDVPVSLRAPGAIVTARFFNEEWALPTAR
jgi:pimeloyl-ACP methyl ester carboxylesterase